MRADRHILIGRRDWISGASLAARMVPPEVLEQMNLVRRATLLDGTDIYQARRPLVFVAPQDDGRGVR